MCSKIRGDLAYGLRVTAILEEGKHDPYAIREAEHLFVRRRAIPETFHVTIASQDLTSLVF